MKKTIFLIGSLILSVSTFGQTKSAFSRMPMKSNGYLVLDKYAFPTVDHWNIELLNPSENDPAVMVVTEKRSVWGTNVEYFSNTSYNGNSSVHVIGFHGSDVIIDQTAPMMNGTPPDALCWQVCNGPDYVYQLTNYDITPGGYSIKMESPYNPPSGFDYYYEWFTSADFVSPTLGPQNPEAHGMNDFYAMGSNLQNHFIVNHYTPQNMPFHNRFGDPISGNLVGVMKYLGPYTEHAINSNELADNICENFTEIQTFIDWVNLNSSNDMVVSCTNRGYASEPADPISSTFVPCLDTWYEYLLDMDNPGVYNSSHTQFNIFFGMISFTVPCGEVPHVPYDDQINGGNGFSWPEDIVALQVSDLDDSRNFVRYLREDFYDTDGNFIGGSLALPEGFIQISYIFSDGSRQDMFVNNEIKTDYSISQADCVEYIAYPVPLTNNYFNLDIESSERVSFTYEIRDQYGNKVYSNSYTLEKDKELNDQITLPDNLPSGTYFNKMTFSDNSEINFQIVK